MKYPLLHCTIFLCFLAAPALATEVSSDEIQALREQIRLLSERLDQLEQRSQAEAGTSQPTSPTPQQVSQTPTAPPEAVSATAAADEAELNRRIDQAVDAKVEERMAAISWAERMRWAGDFRYRYETMAIEDQDDRDRNRIRARANLTADISETFRVGLGLATGGEDPVSTNQTLGGGGSKKAVSLDLAYVEWTGLPNTRVVGGKFQQQHLSAGEFGLIWDSDWRPEGTSFRYDNGRFFASGLGTWIESDSRSSQEEFSFGAQAGMRIPLSESLKMTLGSGFYQFDTRGKSSYFGDNDFFGNSFDPVANTYLYNYAEIEGFAELEFHWLDRRTLLFADYVQNLDVDENNSGYAFGVKYGQARLRGSWEVNYAYKYLEADAVIGLLSDSDFGLGGTDAKGSVLGVAYAVHDNWNFRMTYFLTKTRISNNDPEDVKRLQLDLQFNYQ